MSGEVTPIDFARRAHTQTLRQRKALSQWKRLPNDGPLDTVELERKTLRTEFNGAYALGWLHCLTLLGFVAFIWFWVYVGGL